MSKSRFPISNQMGKILFEYSSKLKKVSRQPDLEAELILAFVLNKPRSYVLAHTDLELSKQQLSKTLKLFTRRLSGEPLAHLTGEQEFGELIFKVNKHTLIPRPETELMVEQVLNLTSNSTETAILDIGTGSGCIAITLAKKLSEVKIIASDKSTRALAVAKINAKNHQAKITWLQGNLLQPLIKKINQLPKNTKQLIITANLPYVPSAYLKNLNNKDKIGLKFEPLLALDGGADGLKYYRELSEQLNILKQKRPEIALTILMEIQPGQARAMKKIFGNISVIKDLAKKDRLVTVKN